MMKARWFVGVLLVTWGVGMLWPARATAAEKVPPLRVGITLDYPPLAMEQDGQVAGLEGDLARHLGVALAWQVSEHESDMSGVWIPLTEEYIAWAVRRGDTELAAQATAVLQTWKGDGTLKALLERWLPYADQIQVPAGTRPELPRLLK